MLFWKRTLLTSRRMWVPGMVITLAPKPPAPAPSSTPPGARSQPQTEAVARPLRGGGTGPDKTPSGRRPGRTARLRERSSQASVRSQFHVGMARCWVPRDGSGNHTAPHVANLHPERRSQTRRPGQGGFVQWGRIGGSIGRHGYLRPMHKNSLVQHIYDLCNSTGRRILDGRENQEESASGRGR